VTVDDPGPSAFHLHQAPGSFCLQHARGTFELHQILAQLLVRRRPQILRAELIEGRAQRAHVDDVSDRAFGAQ
jgi:hypothetical protein